MPSVNERNILAIKQHSEETRKMVRVVEEKNKQIDNLSNKIEALSKQVETLFRRL